MDTALPQKFPFILDRNLAKANCSEKRICTSWDIVVLAGYHNLELIFLSKVRFLKRKVAMKLKSNRGTKKFHSCPLMMDASESFIEKQNLT